MTHKRDGRNRAVPVRRSSDTVGPGSTPARERLCSLLDSIETSINRRLARAKEGKECGAVSEMCDTPMFDSQELDLLLTQQEAARVAQIRAAIRRIDDGSYNSCCDCGEDIGVGRLDALPFATRCRDCAQIHEERAPAAGRTRSSPYHVQLHLSLRGWD